MEASTKQVRRYNSIHRQQLFYWTGRNLDRPSANRTAAQRLSQRVAYVDRLRSLIADGIWLKIPDKPDQLGDGKLLKVSRPIACFSEWSLGQSIAHTSEYGRLGLGFSKQFILSRGGQPVIYVRDAKTNSQFVSALKSIARVLKSETSGISAPLREDLWRHFDFISHFVKAIQKPLTRKKRKNNLKKSYTYYPTGKALDGLMELAASITEKEFKRKYGRFLHYLEEREWRVVYDKALDKHFELGPAGNANPAYYLPFEPGKELYTVVLPDNLTVSLVMRDNSLRKKLFPKDGLPVTLLSLEDIGTF